MSLTQQTRDLAHSFMQNARHVRVRSLAVERIASELKGMNFENSWPGLTMPAGDIVIYELAAGAVNYAYWYGKGSVRPNGSSSVKMYECLDAAYAEHGSRWTDTIRTFAANMAEARMPYAEERAAHLQELLNPLDGIALEAFADQVLGTRSADTILRQMVRSYPGYAADPFLKRAFLFVIQLQRRGILSREQVAGVPVPTDYQIPKILRHMEALSYDQTLAAAVDSEELIPAGSLQEIEIRAATMVVCDRIAELADLAPADVDTFLWLNRKVTDAPFHLTVTTHY